MRIEGYIYDEQNRPVKAVVSMIDEVNNDVQIVDILPGEKYFVEADAEDLETLTIVFSASGYKSVSVKGSELIEFGSNIHLEKSNALFLFLVAAGLFYALYTKKKKVGALTVSQVKPFLLIGGSVIGFVLLKQLLEKLGVWRSSDDKSLDQAAESSSNWWNPGYWKTKPVSASYTNPITLTTARQYAGEIYDSFNWANDCEECVKAIFKRLPSQAAGSFVSYAFNEIYGMDLLDFLRGGVWPQDRLNSEDVNEINRYVSTLPKF